MVTLPGWIARGRVLRSENGKGPWDSGVGGGSGDEGGNSGGPRNPWQSPPDGRRGRVTSLDEFLKRARRGGGGNGGRPGGPGGFHAPGGRSLWIAGVAILIALWLVATSLHQIGPQQAGVVTLFGRYYRTLEPGVRPTLPSPIARVRKIDVQKIRIDDFPKGGGENLMLTGDQNIVDLSYQVRWNVKNPKNFLFQIADPQETVRAVAESAMREVIAEQTLDSAIGAGRSDIENRVQQRMQQLLDGYQSGVAVQGVAIRNASPPDQVDEAFKQVTAAQQEAQANLNQARAYAQQVIAKAQGEAAEFDKIYAQYKLAPTVTKQRLYYETMEDVLAKTDKTIVEPDKAVPYIPLPPATKKAPDEPEVTVTGPSQSGSSDDSNSGGQQ